MSATGIGPFENDFALDLCEEIQDLDGPEILEALRAALQSVVDTPFGAYIERDLGESGVAAAAIVAARALGRHDELGVIDTEIPEIPPMLIDLVAPALERIKQDDSEVRRLWAKAGAEDDWLQMVDRLAADIGSIR
jgi:hypothetical protein